MAVAAEAPTRLQAVTAGRVARQPSVLVALVEALASLLVDAVVAAVPG